MKKKEIQKVMITLCDGCYRDITHAPILNVVENDHEFHFCYNCRDVREDQDSKSLTRMEAMIKVLSGYMVKHKTWNEYGHVKLRGSNLESGSGRFIQSADGSIEEWTKFWAFFSIEDKFRNGWEIFKCDHPQSARRVIDVGYFATPPSYRCAICNKVNP